MPRAEHEIHGSGGGRIAEQGRVDFDERFARIEMRRTSTLIAAMMLYKGETDSMLCGTSGAFAMHLHFIDAERRRGGHVLTCRTGPVEVKIDHARDLHVELPPGIALGAPDTGEGVAERIREVEGDS